MKKNMKKKMPMKNNNNKKAQVKSPEGVTLIFKNIYRQGQIAASF